MQKKLQEYSERFENWLTLRNYAVKSKKSYLCSLRLFWKYCEAQKGNATFTKANAVEHYLLYRYNSQKVSWQTVNGDYSALRLFYINVLGRTWDLRKLPRPRKQKSLPKVISPEQVSLLIEHGQTFKHKVFFTLLYSTGLRLGEALRLRVEDVQVATMQIRVLDGKGNKDRYTLLSAETLDLLRFYIRAYRPKGGLLFNGRYKGRAWSEKGAQGAIRDARRSAKLPEFVTAHTLRHCFATHLLQAGTDLVTIQKLMGHKYLKTTVRYIHLDNLHFQKIDNPADRIQAWEKITESVKSSESTEKNLSSNTAPILPYAVPSVLSVNAEPSC